MSSVSCSVYQKLAEENKRLKADIYALVMKPLSGIGVNTRAKWYKKFKEDAELAKMLHDHAVQYVKDNPNSVAAQIVRECPPEEVNRCVECGCKISATERYCAECLCEDDCDPFS